VKSVAELMGAATTFSGSFRARNRAMEDDSSLLNNIGKFNVCKKLFFKYSAHRLNMELDLQSLFGHL
jgi:hypothetical protein